MGYGRGVGYFVGILIIILGLIFRMQSASTSGIIIGIIIVIVGIIFISFLRKIGKTQKKIKENISGHDAVKCPNGGTLTGTLNSLCPNCGSRLRNFSEKEEKELKDEEELREEQSIKDEIKRLEEKKRLEKDKGEIE
jgi:hypothetical protein